MSFDVSAIRRDFPQLSRVEGVKPLVYLDSTNTSQKPQVVLDAMDSYYREHCSNVHRSIYKLGEEADALYEAAREKVKKFIGAESIREVIFCRNATEGVNLVAHSWARSHLKAGDGILLSHMEHHANLVPWLRLQQEAGVQLSYIPLTAEYRLDMEAYYDLLVSKKPKLVAVTGMSNVLGTVNPLREICDLAHEHGARVLVDAAQLVAHRSMNVQELDSDFLVFTGHKMLGPTGIGVLYGKEELLCEMPAFLVGGDMIRTVSFDTWTANDLPFKFEAGTPNIAGALGLGAAIEYLSGLGMDVVEAHEQELTEYALNRFSEVSGLRLFGPPDAEARGAVFSFELEGTHAHDIAQVLADEGICVRAGHHCAMPLMELLEVPATARASFYVYNTTQEVDRLIEGLRKARNILT